MTPGLVTFEHVENFLEGVFQEGMNSNKKSIVDVQVKEEVPMEAIPTDAFNETMTLTFVQSCRAFPTCMTRSISHH